MLEKKIKLGPLVLTYKLNRRAGNRHLRLAIKKNGDILVSAPKYFPLYLIQRFISQKQEWLLANWQKIASQQSIFSRRFSLSEIKKLKALTDTLVRERLLFFNQFYNFSYRKITVRNQSTRWGSCSKNKNLNFNCRLCLLPPALSDYIIVHELCHLQEMNHGRGFWQLVARTMPDYRKIRGKLRQI